MPNAAGIAELRRENALLAGRLQSLQADYAALKETAASLRDQLDWFKRQLFGRRSEKRLEFDLTEQADLFEALGVDDAPATPEVPAETISCRRRRKARGDAANESGLRFDDTVPVTTVEVRDPAVESIPASERVVVGEKVTHRLAQRPASYEVLRYVRPVVKRRDTGGLVAARAPANVLERTSADVSLLAGMLVDKFRHHLPLHRQHRRMADAGIALSRSSLTNWTGRAIDLLGPVAAAQTAHVLESRVLAMDETPVKAGVKEPGKMRQGYFWPIYGEDDEIVFPFAPTREHRHVEAFLGDFEGVLSSDGYEAYARYAAKRAGVRHAQCWAHARRGFEQARDGEPEAAGAALSLIGALYANEKAIRTRKLKGAAKLAWRRERSVPAEERFFAWCRERAARPGLLPRSPLAKALGYALEREAGLTVYLSDADVPIDTNHLERALRPIPAGKRNWLFAWTEIGAERVGVIQGLLATCTLQGVDAYTYLVDVLQRVGEHPASRAVELTPRVWKTLFADDPLRSDLERGRDPPAS